MEIKLKFIGHSTILIESRWIKLITDPNFRKWIGPFRRHSPLGMKPDEIGKVDVVLVSHGHYDHLSIKSLRSICGEDTTIVVPEGLEKYPLKFGVQNVRVLRWWNSLEVCGVKIHSVPANHFPGRSPFNKTSFYQGYIFQMGKVFYFAGDTGLFEQMGQIGERFAIDVALLPVGAYKPWSVYGHHLTPEDAIVALRKVRAKMLIPIHWGAFKLSFEPLDEPIKRLRKIALREGCLEKIKVLNPGDALCFC